MLKFILLGLAAIIVLFLIVVATRPADFRITRTATIAAPPAVVFEQFNDLHKMNNWSPWAKMDPNCKNTFGGPPAGVGSSLAWEGNNQVGAGKMTVTDSQPNEHILMKLEFLKPFEATHTSEFTFTPDGSGTKVSWSMFGKNSFIGKAITLVMNCDKMIGGQFEQGFANLKEALQNVPVS